MKRFLVEYVSAARTLGWGGLAVLLLVAHAPALEMRVALVAGGGEAGGPVYDFWIGKRPVTVAQFVAFLNDAEANPGNPQGEFLVFQANGDVGIGGGVSGFGFRDSGQQHFRRFVRPGCCHRKPLQLLG